MNVYLLREERFSRIVQESLTKRGKGREMGENQI